MTRRRPSAAFFSRATLEVARGLLGMRLVRKTAGIRTAGLIVETEAYIGEEDLACHASAGRTARNAVMYGPAGHAYVYFVYGMHHCLNLVTEEEGVPAAVLIRALEPVEGLASMAARRGLEAPIGKELGGLADAGLAPHRARPGPAVRALLGGPGRLCQALAIDRALSGSSLRGDELFLERSAEPDAAAILSTCRVGIDYAGPWRWKPWRFLIQGSPWVSPGRPASRTATSATGRRAG
jgi:DNA-3-methyladenine glycosylase